MRKSTMSALVLATTLTATSAYAKEKETEYEHAPGVGLGTGVVIGAIVAGPVGAAVAGFMGAMLGNDIRQDKALEAKTQRLSAQAKLLSERDRALIAMRNQLQTMQQASVTQVAMQEESTTPSISLQSSVQFQTGAYDIAPDYQKQLDLIAKTLKGYPTLTARLTGHADKRGKDEYNQALSMQRAISVKQYLINKGVDSQQILTVALGESQSAYDGGEQTFFDRKVVIELGNEDATLTAQR